MRPASVFAVFLLLIAPALAHDAEAFESGLDDIQKIMAKARWSKAKAAITGLLEEHADQDHVRRSRDRILELCRRCSFHMKHPAPDPKKLVSGKIASWSSSSGKIKLVYSPKTMGDFEEAWENTAWFHPLEFAGPYQIRIRGTRYPRRPGGICFMVAITNQGRYAVDVGWPPDADDSYFPLRVRQVLIRDWEKKEDDQVQSKLVFEQEIAPIAVGKAFDLTVKVASTSISLYSKGKQVFKVRKEKDAWGSLGLEKTPFSEIRIEGLAHGSWLQGLADASLQGKREAFDKTFDPKAELPAWLFDAVAAAAKKETPETPFGWDFPGDFRAEDLEKLADVIDLLGMDDERALKRLRAMSDAELPPATRNFLLAMLEYGMDRPHRALPHAEAVCEIDSKFVGGFILRARILYDLGRYDVAEGALRDVIARSPGEADAYSSLAMVLLLRGKPEEADAVFRQARANNAVDADLAKVEGMLRMSRQGPSWPRVHRHATRHYEILTDIDKATGVEAGKLLEDNMAAYKGQLTWVKIPRNRRFRVYLFSGQAGYESYLAKVTRPMHISTAGVYSPLLKQLLIWNLPDRNEMLRTIRHEGFHQYYDLIVANDITWFNEGMAQYYEDVERGSNSRLSGGRLRRDMLGTLWADPDRIRPLKEFLFKSGKAFYEDSTMAYAQAWALVQFLRETTSENRALFKRLLEAQCEGLTAEAAQKRAFDGVDLDDFERRFREWIDSHRR